MMSVKNQTQGIGSFLVYSQSHEWNLANLKKNKQTNNNIAHYSIHYPEKKKEETF